MLRFGARAEGRAQTTVGDHTPTGTGTFAGNGELGQLLPREAMSRAGHGRHEPFPSEGQHERRTADPADVEEE